MNLAVVSSLLLTTEPRRRRNIAYWAATALLTLLGVAVLWAEVHGGAASPLAAGALTAYLGAGMLAFYFHARFGPLHRRRVAVLAKYQGYHVVLALVAAYAVVPAVRGVVFALLIVVITFCSSCLPRRQTFTIAAVASALLALVAIAMSQIAPATYPLKRELAQLLIASASVFVMVALTGEFSRLRSRLRRQKHELRRLLEESLRVASRDELTRLPNRRRMMEIFKEERSRRPSGHPLCVALLDIDHFKAINDRYGHAVGDEALHTFALQIQAQLRSGDVVGRWGGEEFLLVLPNTRIEEAELVVDRLRTHVGALEIAGRPTPLQLTFSAGISQLAPRKTMDEVIDEADRAMFKAKVAGRNTTRIYRSADGGYVSRAADLSARSSEPDESVQLLDVGNHSYMFQKPLQKLACGSRNRRNDASSRPTELIE